MAVVGHVLHQGVADALDDAALGLNPGQGRVDGNAAVHYRHVVENGHKAGEFIQFNFHHAHHVGRGRDRRRMGGSGLGGDGVVHLSLVGNVGKGHGLVGVDFPHLSALKHHGVLFAAQHVRRDGANSAPQFGAGLFHGFAGDVGGGGGVGAGIVGGSVGVRAEDRHVIEAAIHHFRHHLGQNGIAAGAHVGSADEQVVGAVLAELDSGGANVHVGNTAALHGHGHAGGPNLAVPHIPDGVLFLPAEHLPAVLHAAIQGAGVGSLAVVSGHDHAFFDHVFVTNDGGVNAQGFRQFVDHGLHGEDALGGAVAPIGACRLQIGVDHVVAKAVGLQGAGVQGDGLVAGQAYGGGAVLAVSAGVGQGVQVENPDFAVLVGTQTNTDFHFVPGRTGNLGFFARINQLGGAARLHGDKGGVDITHCCLLCAKPTANSGLFHPNAALRDS